jgi:Uma2 family endonuclease
MKTGVYIPATFEQLLGGRPFLDVGGQLLYRRDGTYVLTQISPAADYTVEDYLRLPEGAPFQLIHAKLVYMPAPTVQHQRIAGRLYAALFAFAESAQCGEVLMSPVDVQLDAQHVLQPDLLFVSSGRLGIIGDRVTGAPDLVAEVLSPATAAYDKIGKRLAYGRAGVQEYWLLSPEERLVEVFVQRGGELVWQAALSLGDTLRTPLLPGWSLGLERLFGG